VPDFTVGFFRILFPAYIALLFAGRSESEFAAIVAGFEREMKRDTYRISKTFGVQQESLM